MLHALVLNDCHVDTFNAVVAGAKFTFHQHDIIFRKSLFTFCTHPTLIRHTLNYLIISVIIIQKRVCTCASVFAGGFSWSSFLFLVICCFFLWLWFVFATRHLVFVWTVCVRFPWIRKLGVAMNSGSFRLFTFCCILTATSAFNFVRWKDS